MTEVTENEVLEFAQRLLEGVKRTETEEYYENAFRYFLPQTVFVKRVLDRQLNAEKWPKLFRLFHGGDRSLHLWIDGVCPSACLMGLLVWMRESSFFNCSILCHGPSGLNSDKITKEVIQAATGGGWNVKLIESSQGASDIAILGHPEDSIGSFVSKMRLGGCLILVDFAKSMNFNRTGLTHAMPAVMEILGARNEVFDESDRFVIQQLFPTRYPVLEQESFAVVYTRTESIQLSSGDSTRRFITPSHTLPMSLRKEITKGACPKELLFSALEIPMASRSSTASNAREHYESKRTQGYESRIHMEGMGRPMLCEETQKILQKDVHEILININGKLAPLDVKYTLKGMDEIITVTDPPSRSRVPCLRTEFFENLNISYPGHTLLCRRSEVDARDLDFLQKSASKAALLCRNFAHTVPVIEEGTQELRGLAKSRRTGTYSAGSGWEKVRGKILDGNRPFFVYPWKHSFKIDVLVLLSMIIFPLLMGLPIALMKFKAETDNTVESHKLYMYAGMCMLGLTTGLFLNAWLGFYFYIHMSPLSYFCAGLIIPGMALVLFKGLTRVAFPFYNAPVCILVMLTAAVLVISYPHIPSRLKAKRKTFRKDISNSTIIINFLVLVFLVNRLLVTNFGQRDAPSLITLSILYPVLVARSTDDCARLAEAFNRKTVAVVEAFFTFVSSVFQMIVFLGIHAKVNPLLVFFLINTTDMFCLFMSGPLAAFLKKKNRRLLKHHSQTAKAEEGEEFSLESFIKWVKDPLKLKPLLIKCYCEVSAKCTFIILSLIIRFGPSSETKGFPFIHDIEESLFFEAVYFTFAELTLWILLQFGVEFYLRKKKCQYML
eukprot:g5874.t1